MLQWVGFAKSVTEKNNRRDGVGSAAKIPCKPRAFTDIGMASKGAGIIDARGYSKFNFIAERKIIF